MLTPYRAQLGLLQREFQKVLGRGAKELAAVEFATVDGFQVGRCSSCHLRSSGWSGGGHLHCHGGAGTTDGSSKGSPANELAIPDISDDMIVHSIAANFDWHS